MFSIHGIIIQYIGTVLMGMSQYACGTIISFSSILVVHLKSEGLYTDEQLHNLVTVTPLGSIVGGTLSFVPLRFAGPRGVIMLQSVPALAFWLVIALSDNYTALIVSRFGISVLDGLTLSCFSTFICEIASPERRGLLSSLPEAFFSVGLMVGYGLGGLLPWRTTALILGLTPNIITLCGLFWLHEGPGWLTAHDRLEEAKSSFAFYRGKDFNPAADIKQMSIKRASEEEGQCGYLQVLRLLRRREFFGPVLVCGVIQVLRVLTGHLVVINYAVSIFQMSNKTMDEYISAVILGSTSILGNLISCCISDRVGRRRLLVPCSLLATVAHVGLGLYMYLTEIRAGGIDNFTWVQTAALLVFIAACSLGILPVAWTLVGEMVPSTVSSIANGGIFFGTSISYFSILKAYPYMIGSIGAGCTFFVFAGFCLALTLFSYFFLPETKGVELEEIQKMFVKAEKPCQPLRKTHYREAEKSGV